MTMELDDQGNVRKRTRGMANTQINKRKFPVGGKIEVRSLEDGFQGSWHAGTVSAYVNQYLHVKYDHILCDDGSRPLVDVVDVSTILNGIGNSNLNQCDYRSHIRPLPPPVKFLKWDLPYGLCVDVYYMEAWWEGVIFDNQNGSDKRTIFFPDLGDEIKVGMDVLRITQDWDEVAENWQRRGSWLFLEVIHDLEQVCPLFVSVKQIWYDMRAKTSFGKIGEWTSNVKASWKELVLEVIGDNLNFFAEEVFKQGLWLAEPAFDFNLILEADLANPHAVVHAENPSNSEMIIDHDTNVKNLVDCCFSAVQKIDKNGGLVSGLLHSDSKFTGTPPYQKKFNSVGLISAVRNDSSSINDSNVSFHDKFQSELPCRINVDPECCPQAVVSPRSDVINVAPEYCPQAVVDYYIHGLDKSLKGSKKKGAMRSKARKHLAAAGWVFWYKNKRGKAELRYNSPEGKCFFSLRQACKGFIDGPNSESIASVRRPRKTIDVYREVVGQVGSKKLSSEKGLVVPSDAHSDISLLIKRGKVDKVRGITKLRMKRNGKVSGSLIKLRKDAADCQPAHVLRSSKRARQEIIPSSSHHNPRTVISWLIDNNVLLPGEKVYYRDRKDIHPKAEGQITRDGIKCCCCQNVFTLNSFGVHAGSTYRRAAANTFLKDGRSLLDCQNELVCDNKTRRCKREPRDSMKHHGHQAENDNICSVCHYGGELVLCDRCPSSFHMSCLGLKDVPAADWFCPSCCCRICGQSKFKDESEHSMDGSFLNCDQCERKYHVECVRKTSVVTLESYPKENWFCSKKCEKISLGLRQLLGKPIPVGVDNLSWTLLKCMNSGSQDLDANDTEALTENYSKLSVALGVMRECFEPLKEAFTNRDIVEDVIFSRGSDLNRLNFRGFYTVLLEKNDEIITVATVRVYGEVAEIPLVGTRNQFRRLGMCRTLMNELEKKLIELGVERLILPTVPSTLNTWTRSFGFSKMTDAERLQFLDHTFLDFQDTILCQKSLRNIDLTQLSSSTGIWPKHHDGSGRCGGTNIEFDGSSAISEVLQAEQTEANGIVDQRQRLVDIDGGNGWDVDNDPVHLAVVVNQPTHLQSGPWLSRINPVSLVEDTNSKEGGGKSNGNLMCYKRRISTFRN